MAKRYALFKQIPGTRLTPIAYVATDKAGNSTFIFRCQCGTEKVISMYSVTRKTDRTRSCGCLKKEVNARACKDLWKEGKARPFPKGNTLWRLRSSHGTFKKGNIPWNKGKKFLTVRYPNGSKKLLLID